MADTNNAIYVQSYGKNIMQLAQQKYSKLLNTVYRKPNVTGKTFFQDQIGEWSMSTKAGRNAATPSSDPNLSRRMATMVDYHDAVLLDRGDSLRSLADPKSAYSIAAAQSIGRKIDDVIIAAATGTAKSGETGSTDVTLTNTVVSTNTGLTFAKVTETKRTFDEADVDMDDRFFIVSPQALEDLLSVEQATSADYNAVKALVRGEIDTWMGFKWITSTRLNSASSTRDCIAFQRYGICLGMLDMPYIRTSERDDLSYSWQIYYEINLGAVRLEEDKVIKVEVIES